MKSEDWSGTHFTSTYELDEHGAWTRRAASLPTNNCRTPYSTYNQASTNDWTATGLEHALPNSVCTNGIPMSGTRSELLTFSDPTLPQLHAQSGIGGYSGGTSYYGLQANYPSSGLPVSNLGACNSSFMSMSMTSSPPPLSSQGSPSSEWFDQQSPKDPRTTHYYGLSGETHSNQGLQDAGAMSWGGLSCTEPEMATEGLPMPQTETDLVATVHQMMKDELVAQREQRKSKDDFLTRARRAGMSYRQIRREGGFHEAESTLRGRYRALTKEREQRVRKPAWTKADVSSK